MKKLEKLDRLPPYVFAEVNRIKDDARSKGKDIIDFGMGNPDSPTPKHIVDAAKKALDDGHHGYVLSNGILEQISGQCDGSTRTCDFGTFTFSKVLLGFLSA